MMNEIQMDIWYMKNGISQNARKLIDNIRSSPPVRRVSSSASNVSGSYCSKKMGVTIQAESHRVELPGILMMEHDIDVLEYYDQPMKIKIKYQSLNGRTIGYLYTPDYFVIKANEAGFEEWKNEKELIKLAQDQPSRYMQDENGIWRCPPGEVFANEYGLYFRIRSSKEINWTYQRNLTLLDDYYRKEYQIDPKLVFLARSIISTRPGIVLSELMNLISIATTDDFYAMIVNKDVYVDIENVNLINNRNIPVFVEKEQVDNILNIKDICSDKGLLVETIDIGKMLNWDGVLWKVLNVGDKVISLQSNNSISNLSRIALEELIRNGNIQSEKIRDNSASESKIKTILDHASKDDIKVANYRYHILKSYLSGNRDDLIPCDKTIKRWLKKYKNAEQIFQCGYVGLLPKTAKKGNRQSKISEEVKKLMYESIENDFETLINKRKSTVYHVFADKCRDLGLIPPSYKTYIKAVNARPRAEQTRKMHGVRAAYSEEIQYMELSQTIPRHGQRPLEIVHIDHTELDIELISSRTGKNIGRPWTTFMTDAYSRRILAVYLSFDPPSYRSCMMVIRECVKRLSKIPQTIVVDGGKEFHSVYFEKLLAQLEINKKQRPPAKARFGSVCERMFGTSNSEFVHNLTGNTQNMKNVRQITKSVNPKTHAIWNFERFNERLLDWAYDVYDLMEHPALGMSPRESYEFGMDSFGYRPQRMVVYDENFRIATLPTTSKGTAKVQTGRGVKINYLYYWSDAFRDLAVENNQVSVRYDPFDISLAYAFVNNKWAKCISEYFAQLQGYTEKEIRIISEEIRKQNRIHGKNFSVNGTYIARFISKIERDERYLEQQKVLLKKQELELIKGGLEDKKIEDLSKTKDYPSQGQVNTSMLTTYEEF